MELFWIFVGVIYVLFRLFREGDLKFSWRNFGGYILTVIPLVVGGLLISISERYDLVGGVIFGALIWIGWFIGLFIWAHSKGGSKEPKPIQPKYTVQELRQKFQAEGFNGISQKHFENLLNNIVSPLNASQTSTVTIRNCYRWMCDQTTWDIDKLTRDEVGARLQVPLDLIPLDTSMPAKEASLKRTTLAKDYLLRKEGLRYEKFKYYLNESDEYYTIFTHFVDEYISEHR